jgi:hypothetical protein
MKTLDDLKKEILDYTDYDRQLLAHQKIMVKMLSAVIPIFLLLVSQGFSISKVNEIICSYLIIGVLIFGYVAFMILDNKILNSIWIKPIEKRIAKKADDLARQVFLQFITKVINTPTNFQTVEKEEWLIYIQEKLGQYTGFAKINKSNNVTLNLFLDVSDDDNVLSKYHIQSIKIYDESDWQNNFVPEDQIAIEFCYQEVFVSKNQSGSSINFRGYNHAYVI